MMTDTIPTTQLPLSPSDRSMLFNSCLREIISGKRDLISHGLLVRLAHLAEPQQRIGVGVRDLKEHQDFLARMGEPRDEQLAQLAERVEAAEADESVQLTRDEWQDVMRSATWYALGRLSYLPSWHAGVVRSMHGAGLLDDTLVEQIRSEITWREERIAASKSENGPSGYEDITQMWLRLREDLAA